MRPSRVGLLAALIPLAFLAGQVVHGQPSVAPAKDGQMLLTVFLRHDQSNTLGEIRAHLDKEERKKPER